MEARHWPGRVIALPPGGCFESKRLRPSVKQLIIAKLHPRNSTLPSSPFLYFILLSPVSSPFALIRSHWLELTQGIFLSFYFLAFQSFYPSNPNMLQQQYVATIQIWTFSTVCLSPRLPENPDWKEGKRSICKSMGGCMQRYRQTRTLWKKGWEWSTV